MYRIVIVDDDSRFVDYMKEFSEAYEGMEKDARRLVNRVFDGLEELGEKVPK